jgi:hypothetical protein
VARRSFRVPSNAHPVDTSAGRTLAPGETIDERDLDLDSAHDQRLVDEVLIDLGDPPAAHEPTKAELLKRAGELDIPGRSSMSHDELKVAIAEAEANGGGDAA